MSSSSLLGFGIETSAVSLPTFEDGSAIIWASLALGRLDRLITPASIDDGDASATPVRSTFNKILEAYREQWHQQPANTVSNLLVDFRRVLAGYSPDSDTPLTDIEAINYCVGLFSAFHKMAMDRMSNIDETQRLTSPGILLQLVGKLKENVFQSVLESFLDDYETVDRDPNEQRDGAMTRFIVGCTLKLGREMLTFIKSYEEWRKDPPVRIHEECHREFATMINLDFLDCVEVELSTLCDEFEDPNHRSRLQRQILVERSIENITKYFIYDSPFVFPPEDLSDSDEMSETDSQMSEEWEEYEVTDLVPVLTGPDTATVADTSTAVPPYSVTDDCSICMAHGDAMRKLKVCGHMFCEDCLAAQLNAQGNYRYRCAICRANMFS